jgi:hypothetical protein
MTRSRPCLLALATVLGGFGPSNSIGAAPVALSVWTESVATKVQPTTAPGASTALTLEGARGAYEAGQIVIRASGAALANVNLSASDLTGNGHVIPAANVTLFREYFQDFTGVPDMGGSLPVPASSPTGDGRLPDALLPFVDPYSGAPVGAPFAVGAGLNQPVWMEVLIPADAAAGTYSGQVTVTATGQAPVAVPVTLTVWGFALPDLRVATTYFGMHTGEIIDYHSGTYDCSGDNCWLSWNQRARTIVKRYEELAHVHRVDVGQNFIPDPGNGCNPPTDWSAYDAAMQPYLDGAYWSDGVPSSWLGTPFTPGADWGIQVQCTRAQYTAMAAAWAAHLKSRGWFGAAVVYALDEPDPESYPAIAQDSAAMQAGDPDWKAHVMDTTYPSDDNVDLLNPALGIYSLCLKCYEDWYFPPGQAYGRTEWQNELALGVKAWFYESNAQGAPYPTFATNTLLGMEPQMMMWGSWYELASGFLMWDTTAWDPGDPWGPNVMYGKTGDGVLVYPGNHDGLHAPLGSPSGVAVDGPIPTYRLKMIREGLQDWALLALADQHGLTAYARAQVDQAYSQLGGCDWVGCEPVNGEWYWRSDPALLQQIRHSIATAIAAGLPLFADGFESGGVTGWSTAAP